MAGRRLKQEKPDARTAYGRSQRSGAELDLRFLTHAQPASTLKISCRQVAMSTW